MSSVLSQTLSLPSSTTTPAFHPVPLQTFAELRKGVSDSAVADFFMWEYFTTKKFYTQGPDMVKQLREVYTPWPSWLIVAATTTSTEAVEDVLEKVEKGCRYFEEHKEEAVQYIVDNLEYNEEDARGWLKGVQFAADVTKVKSDVVKKTVDVLITAGVLGKPEGDVLTSTYKDD
jgi:hypothetical protein